MTFCIEGILLRFYWTAKEEFDIFSKHIRTLL